jgi:hypothetical protein
MDTIDFMTAVSRLRGRRALRVNFWAGPGAGTISASRPTDPGLYPQQAKAGDDYPYGADAEP